MNSNRDYATENINLKKRFQKSLTFLFKCYKIIVGLLKI